MSAVVMATDAQLCHISWIFPLLCVHTHPYTLTHVSSAYKREIPLFVSFICFFFHVACCSCCLCCCGYRRLRAILVNLNCYFTLKALQKRFTVTPLLPFSLSPVVWFLCHFYAHYFAFAACLSLALCLLSIYNHNNKNNGNVPFYCCCCCCTLWAYFDFYSFVVVRRRSRFHCLQSPCRIFITLCIMMSSNAADNLWST